MNEKQFLWSDSPRFTVPTFCHYIVSAVGKMGCLIYWQFSPGFAHPSAFFSSAWRLFKSNKIFKKAITSAWQSYASPEFGHLCFLYHSIHNPSGSIFNSQKWITVEYCRFIVLFPWPWLLFATGKIVCLAHLESDMSAKTTTVTIYSRLMVSSHMIGEPTC